MRLYHPDTDTLWRKYSEILESSIKFSLSLSTLLWFYLCSSSLPPSQAVEFSLSTCRSPFLPKMITWLHSISFHQECVNTQTDQFFSFEDECVILSHWSKMSIHCGGCWFWCCCLLPSHTESDTHLVHASQTLSAYSRWGVLCTLYCCRNRFAQPYWRTHMVKTWAGPSRPWDCTSVRRKKSAAVRFCRKDEDAK